MSSRPSGPAGGSGALRRRSTRRASRRGDATHTRPSDARGGGCADRGRGPGGAEPLYERSEGNPFYMLRSWRALRRTRRQCRRRPVSPHRSRPAIAGELDRLSPARRTFRRPPRSRAIRSSPTSRPRSPSPSRRREALDELIARDLVRPTEVPRRFRFRHPLVRRAVYALPGRLAARGARARGAALAARGATPAARAHHVEQSARPRRRPRRSRCCSRLGRRARRAPVRCRALVRGRAAPPCRRTPRRAGAVELLRRSPEPRRRPLRGLPAARSRPSSWSRGTGPPLRAGSTPRAPAPSTPGSPRGGGAAVRRDAETLPEGSPRSGGAHARAASGAFFTREFEAMRDRARHGPSRPRGPSASRRSWSPRGASGDGGGVRRAGPRRQARHADEAGARTSTSSPTTRSRCDSTP